MDLIANLTLGLASVLSPFNLFACLTGALIGLASGVLPSPAATLALTLPFIFGMSPVASTILCAGICYGAPYGRAAALLYRNGFSQITRAAGARASVALLRTTIPLLAGGSVAAAFVLALAPELAQFALLLGPREYAALVAFILAASAILATGPIFRGLAIIVIGLILGSIGSDIETGTSRLAFDVPELSDGIGFVTVSLGLFLIADMIREIATPEQPIGPVSRSIGNQDLAGTVRATLLGIMTGIFGGGHESFAFTNREDIIDAAIADNARVHASFLPFLSLGLPSNAAMALLMGAMTIHGIVPGPQVMTKTPELFWATVISMFVGSVALPIFIVGGVLPALVRVPYRIIAPVLLALCCFGTYSVNNSTFDVLSTFVFGIVGYAMVLFNCERSLLLLGFILGPLLEENIRRGILVSRGDPMAFVNSPFILMLFLGLFFLLGVRARRSGALQRWYGFWQGMRAANR